MNGLPAIANNLASQGRYGDSMLMHVSPGEVAGLQALAKNQGTSLTINPSTGLPEAFSLKSLLPMIAGIALAPLTAGTSLAFLGTPLGAGMTIGGIEALRTKDLGRGLMAGLGAYGGAGLGSALGSAGAASMSNAGNIAAQQAVDASIPIATAPTTSLAAQNVSLAGQGLSNLFASGAPGEAARSAFIGQAANPALNAPATGLGGGLGAAKTVGYAVSPALAEAMEPKPLEFPTPEDPYANYAGPYKPTKRNVMFPTEEELRSSREFMYFDPSNPMPFAQGGEVDRAIRMPTAVPVGGPEFNHNFRPVEIQGRPFQTSQPSAPIGGRGLFQGIVKMIEKAKGSKPFDLSDYQYNPATQQMVKMASGGSVPMLEDGGFVLTKKAVDGLGGGKNDRGQVMASRGLGALPIKGKGHGTSDSIATTIDGKVPARVSNGEAYVPKNAVKRAGGADKLYALMKKAERRA